jgi:hypothetical protein
MKKKKTTPVMSPTFGFALLAIHAARQQGYTLPEILQAASGDFTAAEDAEIEAPQIASQGYVFAPAAEARAVIRNLITAALNAPAAA